MSLRPYPIEHDELITDLVDADEATKRRHSPVPSPRAAAHLLPTGALVGPGDYPYSVAPEPYFPTPR